MSDAIKAMLRDRERGSNAREAALRREVNRRLLERRRVRFFWAFRLMQRFHEAVHCDGKRPPLDEVAIAEGAHLAADSGWDAERAWNYSATREAAIEEAEAEIARLLAEPVKIS